MHLVKVAHTLSKCKQHSKCVCWQRRDVFHRVIFYVVAEVEKYAKQFQCIIWMVSSTYIFHSLLATRNSNKHKEPTARLTLPTEMYTVNTHRKFYQMHLNTLTFWNDTQESLPAYLSVLSYFVGLSFWQT